jgi:serine/threonine protein kinase
MPEQISSYRLENELARGGMGIVYRGVHTVFEEVVAIKAIFPELTLNPELRSRFVNEAKIQRRLQHPNIVQIREFLIEQGRFYIVMELIEGETLAQRLKRLAAPMPAKEALGIFRQALQGLAFAHAQGVIHRDMKPSNIMLTREGVAKLTDFGIARAVGVAGLTRTGMVLGTPAYMAPEQVQGRQVDKRSDIYALGVTLYEMVAGRVPFERPVDSDSDFTVMRAHLEEPPQPPSRLVATIPPFIEAAVLKAMAKLPDERFASCEEFEAALVPPEQAAATRITPASQPSVALRPATPEPAAIPEPAAQPAPVKTKTTAGYLWPVSLLAVVLALGGYWFYRVRPGPPPTVTPPPTTEPSATKPSAPAPVVEQPTGPAGATSAQPKEGTTQKAPATTPEAPARKPVPKPAESLRGRPAAVPGRVGPAKPSATELAAQVQALIKQANAALDRGQYDAAISAYHRALELDSTNQEARAGIDRAQRAKAAEEATK